MPRDQWAACSHEPIGSRETPQLASCRYRRAHDDPTHGSRGHRGRRPRGRDGVLRRARTQAAGRGAGRGRLGGPRGGARGRPGGDRDGGDPGRPRTARADEVSRPVGPGRRPCTRRRTLRASATSHSRSTTSTPPSLACEPAAGSSLARWRTTKTSIGSATSAARRGSSSSWRSGSAEGSGTRRLGDGAYHVARREEVTLDPAVELALSVESHDCRPGEPGRSAVGCPSVRGCPLTP